MTLRKIKPRLPLEPLEIDLIRYRVTYYEKDASDFISVIMTAERPREIPDLTYLYIHAIRTYRELYPDHLIIDIDILSEPAPAKPAESEI